MEDIHNFLTDPFSLEKDSFTYYHIFNVECSLYFSRKFDILVIVTSSEIPIFSLDYLLLKKIEFYF